MDIISLKKLSKNSRDILNRLSCILTRKKMGLRKLSNKVFGHERTKFTLKQFHMLIKKYDPDVVQNDVDQIFKTLDQNQNDVVFIQTIQFALKKITEQAKLLAQQNSTIDKEELKIYEQTEFKTRFLASEDYTKIARLFVTQKKALIQKDGFASVLNNLSYGEDEKTNLTKAVFGNKSKISVRLFLYKLGLISLNVELHEIEEQQTEQFTSTEQCINSTVKQICSLENIPAIFKNYHNMKSSEVEQWFVNLAVKYLKRSQLFVDMQNPSCVKAKFWSHIADIKPDYRLFQLSQQNIKEDPKGNQLGVLLQPRHINQGRLGDCYFLSGVAALAYYYPQLIHELFILDKNPSHIFGVKLFVEGQWKTFAIDGYFPINIDGTFHCALPSKNQIWTMLIQKAWAKAFKSYEVIHGGTLEEGLTAISGAPSIYFFTEEEDFLRKIIVEFDKGSVITCSSSLDTTQLLLQEQHDLGIYAYHAYTLLKVYQKLPYKNSEITLLKLRNPWGRNGWKGDWSYGSTTWTEELREKVGQQSDPKDGTFFMSLGDFAVYFGVINISKVKLGYKNSSVTNYGFKKRFYENRFAIKQKADYFFTIYQESPRRQKGWPKDYYLKSKTWLFLAKILSKSQNNQIDKLNSIACLNTFVRPKTIQATLQPGEYVLISKVGWQNYDEHDYNVVSYGPTQLEFSEGKIVSDQILNKFIESRAKEVAQFNRAQLHKYEGANIEKRYQFNNQEGIGYVTITNLESQTVLETTINLGQAKGVEAVPPYSLPLAMNVGPLETRTAGFIVDPQIKPCSFKEKFQFITLK